MEQFERIIKIVCLIIFTWSFVYFTLRFVEFSRNLTTVLVGK